MAFLNAFEVFSHCDFARDNTFVLDEVLNLELMPMLLVENLFNPNSP